MRLSIWTLGVVWLCWGGAPKYRCGSKVGEAYEFGYGVRKDWAQAVEYYRKSALQGNQRARERLAKASVKW